MAKTRAIHRCESCGQQVAQWVGKCPGCGEWGSIAEVREGRDAAGSTGSGAAAPVVRLGAEPGIDRRVPTGIEGVDRVLGGGLVPGSVVLLAGEPGIGKSTLLLHMLDRLAAAGSACLLVSGEESHAQIASRAKRLGVDGERISFAPGRDLGEVVATALAEAPSVVAVDSIQTIREPSGGQMPGGVSQVRICTDALVGFAKSQATAVILTGHVTKDGDLAGPRSLEHAVDVVLAFDGDPRSGLRVLSAGKNRFGSEGETAWFEMSAKGLREIDPTELLVSGERMPGAAVALPTSGRRAFAVEIQALVGSAEGSGRRQATGLDGRRFPLVAAVLDSALGLPLGRAELYGATAGGVKVDDPAADLAIAAALVSAATGVPAPEGSAFVGELSLTGSIRPAAGLSQRLQAARAAGCTTVFVPWDAPQAGSQGVEIRAVRHVAEALGWASDLRERRSAGVERRSPSGPLGGQD